MKHACMHGKGIPTFFYIFLPVYLGICEQSQFSISGWIWTLDQEKYLSIRNYILYDVKMLISLHFYDFKYADIVQKYHSRV